MLTDQTVIESIRRFPPDPEWIDAPDDAECVRCRLSSEELCDEHGELVIELLDDPAVRRRSRIGHGACISVG